MGSLAERIGRIAESEDTAHVAAKITQLLAHSNTAEVTELHLHDNCLEAPGMRALLAAPWPRLASLHISDSDSTADIARIITEAELPALRELWFLGYIEATLGDEGCRVLAESPALADIEHLALINCAIGPAGAAALAASTRPNRLRALNLGVGNYTLNRIGPHGAKAIARSPALATLTSLYLDFNAIGDDGVVALARSTTLGSLEYLSLQANEFGDDAFADLVRSATLAQCDVLDVSHNRIGFLGVDAMCRAHPPELHTLWLYHNPLGDKAVRALAASPLLAQLRVLNLNNCELTDDAVDALLDSDHAPASFELLHVGLNHLSDRALGRLRERFGAAVTT